MNKIIVGILICMLLITTILPTFASAGDSENPEVEDRILDVKLFGIIPFLLQKIVKYSDIISAWFYEEQEDSEYLYVSMKVRDLQERTDLEAIYVVSWVCNFDSYSASVHVNPNGITPLFAGKNDEEGNDYVEKVECDGSFNLEEQIITWKVPKDIIGNPQIGTKLTDIHPHTHLRFRDDSNLPHMDLFKDLAWNAKSTKDYVIQY
jgi:hypothetical protein